jgi:hypothetical protein
VRILVNQGNGTFTSGPSITVGNDPRSMAIGDLDNDGDLDLGVANRGSDTVSVLRNMGSLSFTVTSYAAGTDPRGLGFGDVTGDGRADIAVAAHDDRAVRVLANAGSATFTQLATLSLGQLRPQGIAIGQLNGAGSLDIAASAGNNGVEFASVVLSLGNGSFGARTNYPVLGRTLPRSSPRTSTSTATSTSPPPTPIRTTSRRWRTTRGRVRRGAALRRRLQPGPHRRRDLDQNGSPDLVTTNETSNNVSILPQHQQRLDLAAPPCMPGQGQLARLVAAIGSTGTPSLATGDFAVR